MSDTDSDQSQSIPEQALVLQINQFLHMADVAMHEYKSSLAREMRTNESSPLSWDNPIADRRSADGGA